jgi:hypothetical protein
VNLKGNNEPMKTLFKFIAIGMLVWSLGGSVFAQGNINTLNGGTNLAVVSATDTVNTAIIAQQYIGGTIKFPATGGAVVIGGSGPYTTYGMSNIVVYGYTVTSYGGGYSNTLNYLIPHTSGSRVGVFITNLGAADNNPGTNYDIGIKLGSYPVGGVPDYVILGGQCQQLYFEGGYNGEISARSLSSSNESGGIIFSEIGNSPGQP